MSCKIEKNPALYALEIRIISMYNETDSKEKDVNTFTVRLDTTMQDMISYLQDKKMLNKTSIIRWAVAEAYQREKANEIKNDGD